MHRVAIAILLIVVTTKPSCSWKIMLKNGGFDTSSHGLELGGRAVKAETCHNEDCYKNSNLLSALVSFEPRSGRTVKLQSLKSEWNVPSSANLDISSDSQIQDLEHMQRTLQAWEAKLMKFRERFGDSEALTSNPVWNKLLRIRNSLVHLVEIERKHYALNQSRKRCSETPSSTLVIRTDDLLADGLTWTMQLEQKNGLIKPDGFLKNQVSSYLDLLRFNSGPEHYLRLR